VRRRCLTTGQPDDPKRLILDDSALVQALHCHRVDCQGERNEATHLAGDVRGAGGL
jgi:hypothetical protein